MARMADTKHMKSRRGAGNGAAARLSAIGIAARALAALALIAPGAAAAAPLRIVTDIAPVHGLVAMVAQGAESPKLLIDQQASPHGYAMRPSEARMLAEADVVIHVGGGLAPWLENAVGRLAADARILELIDVPATVRRDFRTAGLFGEAPDAHGDDDHGHGHGHDDEDAHGHAEEDAHDHDDHGHGEEDAHGHDDHGGEESHGDEDGHDDHGHEDGHDDHGNDDHGNEDEGGHGHNHAGGVDPHAWLDVDNGILWLEAIAGTLAQADPENADLYLRNARAGQARLTALAAEIDATLRAHRSKPYVVFHDAYQYFERRFDLAALGSISLHDAASPGPARLASVRDGIARHGVSCVFSEPQLDDGLIDAVTRGRAVRVKVIDPLGADLPLGPGFYGDLLRGISTTIADCLGRA